MEKMLKKRRVPHICWLLLAVLQISTPSSAQNTTEPSVTNTSVLTPKPAAPSHHAPPNNVSMAGGGPVVFRCAASEAAQMLTFTLYSSHGNYSLTCPNGYVEDILQGIYGRCEVNNGEILSVWTFKGASYSDNDTRVFCQQSNDPEAQAAVLLVDDNWGRYAVLIGCTLGGFFGVLLVFGLLFLLLKKSERFQNCLGLHDTDDDFDTIIKE